MTAIIDYGVGNLFSLKSSLAYIGADCVVTSDPEVIKRNETITPTENVSVELNKENRFSSFEEGLENVLVYIADLLDEIEVAPVMEDEDYDFDSDFIMTVY